MIKDNTSPFNPGKPVSVEYFVGRVQERGHLERKLRTAAAGKLQVAFLTGPKAIGKSSLAHFIRFMGQSTHEMLGVHVMLGGVTTVEGLAQKVFDRLVQENAGEGWFQRARQFFGDHVKITDIGLFGITVKFAARPEELQHLSQNFAPALRNLAQRIKPDRKGILLILDDVNGLANSEAFANWLKSLVDEIAIADEEIPLFLLLVGLEERRQALIRRQESLGRVFDLVRLEPWQPDETQAFFEKAFTSVGIAVEDAAMEVMVVYSEGFPEFAHEIGDAAFHKNTDGVIDEDDAHLAVAVAAEIIGTKYLEGKIIRGIQSPRYRSILTKLVLGSHAPEFERAELRKLLDAEELRVADAFLRRMEDIGLIKKAEDGGPGCYCFTQTLHHAYFYMRAIGLKTDQIRRDANGSS